jgi:hydrogenase maturation protease
MKPSPAAPEPVLVIGVGNAYRGDDAAGLAVAGYLRALAPAGIDVVEHAGDPVSLMDAWGGYDRVYLVDAVVAGGVPGSVYRFDPGAGSLAAWSGGRGTHGAGVAEAIGLARALSLLPPRLTVYGIEGGSFDLSADLSPAVRRAVTDVCARLWQEFTQRPVRAPGSMG